MDELDGKVALVTGAARGFGRAVALLLASEGADVIVSDIARDLDSDRFYAMSDLERLEATADEVRALGPRALAVQADVTSASDCQDMAEAALASFGRVDILVANAGIWSLASAWEFTEEEWDVTVDVNLKGAWLTAKYVVPHMIERRYGKVIFTSSIGGIRAYPKYAPYVAAKHGVIGLMRAFAIELGPYEITVNAICPTQMGKPVATEEPDPVWAGFVGHPNPTAEEFEAAAAQENLFESLGIPDFPLVAEAVLWLASDRSRMVTGHALPVDAGWVAKRGG